jgi:hypothetical protein
MENTSMPNSRPEWLIVPPDQVQPGDVYKFTPIGGSPMLYGHVMEVLPEQNLCQVRGLRGGPPMWTYIKPPVGEVTFGRQIQERRDPC